MTSQQNQSGRETGSFINGLLLGFLVSAPIAAWLSPRSGPQTRATIRQKGVLIRRRAGETLRKPLEQVQERVENLRGDSVEDSIAEGKAIAAQKRAEKTNTPD